jgi:hypothetical protein
VGAIAVSAGYCAIHGGRVDPRAMGAKGGTNARAREKGVDDVLAQDEGSTALRARSYSRRSAARTRSSPRRARCTATVRRSPPGRAVATSQTGKGARANPNQRCNELQRDARCGDKPVRPRYAHVVDSVDNSSASLLRYVGRVFVDTVGRGEDTRPRPVAAEALRLSLRLDLGVSAGIGAACSQLVGKGREGEAIF